jgi:hypothetical protein
MTSTYDGSHRTPQFDMTTKHKKCELGKLKDFGHVFVTCILRIECNDIEWAYKHIA